MNCNFRKTKQYFSTKKPSASLTGYVWLTGTSEGVPWGVAPFKNTLLDLNRGGCSFLTKRLRLAVVGEPLHVRNKNRYKLDRSPRKLATLAPPPTVPTTSRWTVKMNREIGWRLQAKVFRLFLRRTYKRSPNVALLLRLVYRTLFGVFPTTATLLDEMQANHHIQESSGQFLDTSMISSPQVLSFKTTLP